MSTANQKLSEFFNGTRGAGVPLSSYALPASRGPVTFSSIFFSDVRKDVPDQEKYRFVRQLVEFADQNGFASICFPERHFYEFGSIHANNAVMAAYFAPLTRIVRLRAASVSAPLHHPAAIVESWAMVDVLSGGRVDIGFGSGWNKPDFVLSPDTYESRADVRDQMIPVIQRLWRGETVEFPGPGGEMLPIQVYPRPVQPELQVWYSTFSEKGFEHAGKHGYNIYTMLLPASFDTLADKIRIYRQARAAAGFDPETGIVSLLMHTFVHPDSEWVQRSVAAPFKEYIASSVVPQMKALDKDFDEQEVNKIIEYSYARYFQTGGIFGSVDECQKQVDKAVASGVNDIALLQDFGVDFSAVQQSLTYVEQLLRRNREVRDGR